MRVTCPSCESSYRLKPGASRKAVLKCKHCGERFSAADGAQPPAVGDSAGAAPRPAHRYRASKSSFGLVFGMLVAVAAVSLVAILALATRPRTPSFAELAARLGISTDRGAAPCELDQTEFMNRIGKHETPQVHVEGRFVYVYCSVQEGRAEIILDRGPWEVGRSRVRQIALHR